jgi:GH25 family lysozyme M1 (1,4-beta-N-acetylmuramidase)
MISRRRFVQAGAGALGLGAVAGPIAQRTRGGDWMPWGIDVSHWQGTINWNMVADAGVAFVFMKATEGTTFRDGQFTRNWSEARRVGLFRGAYHFAQPGRSPTIAQSAINQANYFINNVNPGYWDLWCVLDFETTNGLARAELRTWIQAFVNRVKQRMSGYPPIIYTSPNMWINILGNPPNMGCPLWLAHWTTGYPTVPGAWSDWHWTFWQFSNGTVPVIGRVPGISGPVDQDTFLGTYWDLANFVYYL